MWFEAQDPVGEQAGFGLLDKSGNPRPAFTAFKTMTTCLGQSPRPLGWLALGKDGRGYGFVFEGTAAPMLVAWMPAGATGTITFPATVQVTDALTSVQSNLAANEPLTLTDTPLFILNLPPDLSARPARTARKTTPGAATSPTPKPSASSSAPLPPSPASSTAPKRAPVPTNSPTAAPASRSPTIASAALSSIPPSPPSPPPTTTSA